MKQPPFSGFLDLRSLLSLPVLRQRQEAQQPRDTEAASASIGLVGLTMDVNNTMIQLNMTSAASQNETNIEGHLMTQGWRIIWNTFFGGSMFLSILGNLAIIIMMWGKQ